MSARRLDPRTPLDDVGKLAARIKNLESRLDMLSTPTGTQRYQAVKKLQDLVADIQRQLDDYIANGTYNKSQLDQKFQDVTTALSGKAATVHTHDAADIISGTLARPVNTTGAGTFGGDVSGATGVFSTGVRSAGARANQVTTGYVAAYIDAAGNLGYAPSTRASKDIGDPYAVDMAKFLALNLYNWQYKNNGMKGIGPIADDMEAAGLSEFLTYHPATGKLQGLRYETLIFGLWSAYVQSRTSTLARIAKQAHKTVSVAGMAAITLGGTKNYPIVWDTPFADADYMVVPKVYSSAGVVLTGVSAAEVPGTKTATGITIQVASGVTLLSGSTLIVEGLHV